MRLAHRALWESLTLQPNVVGVFSVRQLASVALWGQQSAIFLTLMARLRTTGSLSEIRQVLIKLFKVGQLTLPFCFLSIADSSRYN